VRWAAPLLLLIACGRDSGWTEARAMGPFLVALDRDGDGAVEAEECAHLAGATPGFPAWDLDADGRLEERELAAVLRGPDPMAFDAGLLGALPPRPPHPPDRRPAGSPDARLARDVLAFLVGELRAAGYPGALPGPEDQAAVVGAGGLGSPEGRALLADLAEAYAVAGLRFPAGSLPRDPVAP
jgi:hypothetical protein